MIRISQCESLTVCHSDRLESTPEFVTWDLSFGHKIRLFLQLSCKRGVSRAYNWYEVICSNQQETRATFVAGFDVLADCVFGGSRGSPALCAAD